MSDAIIHQMKTPDGAFTMLADDRGRILASGWTTDVETILGRLRPKDRPVRTKDGDLDAADAVVAYYGGDLAAIEGVEVSQRGTPLQMRGWAALRQIPAGEPLTYAGFAEALGAPSAVRAAASICARNAPALFVPCHRVLRTGGGLGGFAWGTEVKSALLAREAADTL